jgi:hypothetical protein
MQVLASARPRAGRPSRFSMLFAVLVGVALVALAGWVSYLVFMAGLLQRFMPTGHPSTAQLVSGALAWTVGLTAPAGFGIVGLARLATAYERWRARRPRVTPAVRLRRAIGDDHVVATYVRPPDGNRAVPELVIGPFGAAVLEELPPPQAVLSRGVRSWEVRAGSGLIHTIANPLEQATHDAERVRAWLAPDTGELVLRTYAAVVGQDPRVERTAACAVIRPEQVAEWLSSLPPQRSLDAGRRDHLVREIRAAL